ncbi:MAG TPA: hypothetical protein VF369_08895 [candidate division Zixibacteria bacterium]
MGTGEILWNGLAAFLTLCIFSILYKDNPFYKLAEHLVVGVSAGYFAIILYYNSFIPKVWVPVVHEHKLYYLLPTVLGILMWTRFSRKRSWISRYPIAAYMGIGMGVAIPVAMQALILVPMNATMQPMGFTSMALFNNLLVAAGVLCALVYFFFSKEHTGVFGGLAKVGIWTLMVGFGAGFGLTVMGRVSLLIERFTFMRDYIQHLLGL